MSYGISPLRKDDACKRYDMSLKVFETHVRVYAVFFPAPKTSIIMSYWSHPGVGIHSRMAEDMLQQIDSLREIKDDSPSPNASAFTALVHKRLRERIAGLLERAPLESRETKVSFDDVYLYPTGMASLWNIHRFLQRKYGGSIVLFGFSFHSTIHLFEEYRNPGFKFFGQGNEADIDALSAFLASELSAGRKVTELYAEFPANPLLTTPDITRLRKLADQYDFVLVVDDTISSFASVDLLGVADILCSSLTKSFSGYADVMGASAVLSPSSPKYVELKALLATNYEPVLYVRDAEVLEHNSEDYLERSTILNRNAQKLAEYLQTYAANPSSCVKKVFYPTLVPSGANYTRYMRPSTPEFTPGYGCLLTLEFENISQMRAAYDVVGEYIHVSPHLGAHRTLMLPYAKALYAENLDWAAGFDVRETQMRISVGLEDVQELKEAFTLAIGKGDGVERKSSGGDVVESLT